MNNMPFPIRPEEWDEIVKLEFIRESWGLDSEDDGSGLASQAYGVRFNFVSGTMPGYRGDLFILKGDDRPMVLTRDQDHCLVLLSPPQEVPMDLRELVREVSG